MDRGRLVHQAGGHQRHHLPRHAWSGLRTWISGRCWPARCRSEGDLWRERAGRRPAYPGHERLGQKLDGAGIVCTARTETSLVAGHEDDRDLGTLARASSDCRSQVRSAREPDIENETGSGIRFQSRAQELGAVPNSSTPRPTERKRLPSDSRNDSSSSTMKTIGTALGWPPHSCASIL